MENLSLFEICNNNYKEENPRTQDLKYPRFET